MAKSELELLRTQNKELQELLEEMLQKPRDVGTALSAPHVDRSVSDTYSFIRVQVGGGEQVIIAGTIEKPKVIKPGDEVLIIGGTVEAVMPKGLKRVVAESKIKLVDWDKVGGLKDQLKNIEESILLPLKKPEVFKKYGINPISGILLHGEPGCGKTLIAKAIAQSFLETAKNERDAFIHLKGSDILDMYIGNSEKIISGTFQRAREFMKKAQKRCVIFIDEAEAILSHRGATNFSCVPAFLAEMDGIYEEKPLVILATNHARMLDDAIVREGRMDIKLHIGRPTLEEFKEIFSIHMKGRETSELPKLIDYVSEQVFSTSLKDRVSGAMAQLIANSAASKAAVREIKENKKSSITLEDMKNTIQELILQN